MFAECLSRLPETLSEPGRLPSESSLAALPGVLRELVSARAARAAETPLTKILASDWLAFSRTGDRAKYEGLYFPRRRRLTDLVCGLLLEDNPAWLDEAVDTVWALCEESAWQLPAHNSYVRDTPQLPWPDVSRPVVDLFAAETGALLAVTARTLGDRLPREVHDRILLEVNRRILTPYRTEHFWWMGNGDEPMCNWTTWCTQNVLLCAFCLPFGEETRRAVIGQAAASLDCFVKDYGEDGCCSEGAQYYGHAALCLFGCLTLLTQAAPGAFDALWTNRKVANMAAFIYQMHVAGNYYVNFADCSPFAGRRGAREYLFAVRTGNEGMADFAARDWLASLSDQAPDGDVRRINLWYSLLELEAAPAMAAAAALPERPQPAGDVSYPSNGVYLARRGDWTLAAKAGNNADSHNHNDVGSVTVYRSGRPFLIDLGVETYSRKTFSAQRYEIWTMQSSWHNLPSFDGVMQRDGAEYRARDVQVTKPDGAFRIEMELSAAWPQEAGLARYTRAVTLAERGLRIEDRCEGSFREAELHLLTQEKPSLEAPDCVRIGALGALRFSGQTGGVRVETIPVTDARLRIAWPDTLYRLVIPFASSLIVEAT